ncbi:hypothetical protein EC08BKT55439_0522 [Escherichia coli 08BKT055439]|uniref:Uncharacterized protein n=2 Tax=Escherichia coli TaxID=562 RepID=A0AAV3IAS0_ECOLX|nr:hypothetical protein ECDEC3E_0619 [Escherichia coli DEC3E]EHV29463.1 hypothetical protein ECDEC5A_0417 [Escherichia coli DEC5A]EHV36815.1 hypothetical protein ECDEC5B_0655 [Escherichia coli DEC5B]EIN29346.1 hypothetical protein ECFRIK1996_0605 [Escherichia coli FRIK1996]EIN31165.1 hypothetical protein ECFDA517_0655 [Escherichia coli FDA517]EIP06367.1 hypothetical protein ECTW09195_0507 [Escherichia coli TW09195]EIP46363.1 hypothetical protein ECEC4402_0483 [Escherichia coli EC4402]EIP5471
MRISDLHVLTINTKYMSERFLQPNRIQLPVKQAKKNRSANTPRFF